MQHTSFSLQLKVLRILLRIKGVPLWGSGVEVCKAYYGKRNLTRITPISTEYDIFRAWNLYFSRKNILSINKRTGVKRVKLRIRHQSGPYSQLYVSLSVEVRIVYLIAINSISNMRVSFGPILAPAPRSPYPRSEGTYSLYLAPVFMS